MISRGSAFLLLVAVLVSCGGTAGGPTPAPSVTLEGTAWVLELLRGQPLIAGTTITLEFKSGQVVGSAGCNGYGGPFQVQGDQLTVGQVARTMMFCESPAGVMEQEENFSQALSTVARYQATSGRLELLDAAGQVVLALAPQPPAPAVALEGTEWVLTSFVDAGNAASVLAGTEVTLQLEQGDASGMGGCNSYGGSYTRQGGSLTFGPLIHTDMACENPAGVMKQESQYLSLLQSVITFEIEGNQLTLHAVGGTELVFRAR